MGYSISVKDELQSHIGINKNIEYSWSNNIDELIVQYYFQLIRGANFDTIAKHLSYLLGTFYHHKHFNKLNNSFTMCYKLLAHTRDIRNGKGERDLSYLQLCIWYRYYPDLTKYALSSFIFCYGSWRDVKGLCGFIKKHYCEDHLLIDYAISVMICQLKTDEEKANNKSPISARDLSLAARWAPRQKSKHGWLFNKMAYQYYSCFFRHGTKKKYAKRKAKTYFRKLLSRLNRILQTPQIYMCKNEWSQIHFNDMTSKTLNKIQKVMQKENLNADRTICKKNLQDYILSKSDLSIFSTTIYEYEMVQWAMNIKTDIDKKIVNMLWHKQIIRGVKNVVAMVDVSAYMSNENNIALMSAIGIGIRISENDSIFKNCLLLFAEYPVWVCFNNSDTFVDKIQHVIKQITLLKGTSCQFYSAFQMIFDSVFFKNIPYIIILSHMQIERRVNSSMNTLYIEILKMYSFISHIIFWNLYPTNGFPVISNQKNVTMISGYNASFFKTILTDNIYNKQYMCTPHDILHKILSHRRYDVLKKAL